MTGTLHANTIQKANGDPVDLTGQSAAKCFGAVTYSAGTPTLNTDLSISSITDQSTGNIQYSTSVTFADATSIIITASRKIGSTYTNCDFSQHERTASTFDFDNYENAAVDPAYISVTVHGDLA